MDNCGRKRRQTHPKETSNILALLTFWYTLPLFKKGYKKDLVQDDLYEVINEYQSKQLTGALEVELLKQKHVCKDISFIRLVWNFCGWTYLFYGFIKLFFSCLFVTINPYAFGKLVSYFQVNQTELTRLDAVYYAGLLSTINFINFVFTSNYNLAVLGIGIRVRIAFCSLLYRKALKLSPFQLGHISIGKIVNIFTKDLLTFESFFYYANDFWIGIIQATVISYNIYAKIGLAALVGVCTFLGLLPMQVYLGSLSTRLKLRMCSTTDDRLQLTQEALSAIKIIKIYAWEWFFKQRIDKTRKKEMTRMHWTFYVKFIAIQLSVLNTKVAFYLLIMTYSWLGNQITAEVVYYITSAFHILSYMMSYTFPRAISETAELVAAVKRIGNILNAPEIQTIQNHQASKEPQIICDKLCVKFHKTSILFNVNLKLQKGISLITGRVGSGKSFFLKTILNDYEASSGELTTVGRLSYASQESWLFPSTIRQNILFGQEYNQERYEKVLDVCALTYDFNLLPDGDNTIVEDRGINLSKGQQARINLARAVYKESDIYLLDDCLSSLDGQVSRFIFDKCIRNYLTNKLVVLVSHNTKLIQFVDNVILMENGTIKSFKSSNQLSEKNVEKFVFENISHFNTLSSKSDLFTEDDALLPLRKKVYQEHKAVGKVNFQVYKRYSQFAGGWMNITAVMGFFGLNQFIMSYCEKLVSKWVNLEQEIANFTIFNATNSTEELKVIDNRNFTLDLYTTMTILTAALNLLACLAFFSVAKQISIKMHKYMLEHVIYARMHFFDNNFIGNILNRFSKDLTDVDECMPFVLYYLFLTLWSFLGTISLVIMVNTWFLIPSLIIFVVFFIVARSPVVGHLNATLEGLTTIRAFGVESILRDEFDRHQDHYTSANYTWRIALKGFGFFMDFFCNIFTSVVFFSFVLGSKDVLVGNVGLAISQAYAMAALLEWSIRQWIDVESSMTAVERVLEYTNVLQEPTEGIAKLENWPRNGEIKFKNIFLSYDQSDQYVLKNINFTIKAKEKVGIVGRTGAGKSSIIATLFRLYEVDGSVLIDGIDIKDLSLVFLRKHISIIPQDPVLFSGTIRDNIDPIGVYSDEEVWLAIEAANLKQYIPSLAFTISENGANFSVGQRQLICLARAYICKNKIIVLDEATANMDQQTDALIYETIHQKFENCTVITIAHKMHTVFNSDKIVVMEAGEIIEHDSPVELLKNKNSAFYQMIAKSELLTLSTNF